MADSSRIADYLDKAVFLRWVKRDWTWSVGPVLSTTVIIKYGREEYGEN